MAQNVLNTKDLQEWNEEGVNRNSLVKERGLVKDRESVNKGKFGVPQDDELSSADTIDKEELQGLKIPDSGVFDRRCKLSSPSCLSGVGRVVSLEADLSVDFFNSLDSPIRLRPNPLRSVCSGSSRVEKQRFFFEKDFRIQK